MESIFKDPFQSENEYSLHYSSACSAATIPSGEPEMKRLIERCSLFIKKIMKKRVTLNSITDNSS